MAVLLRTAVAFLFLACIGANGQAIPEYPRPEFQSEMVPPVDQATQELQAETVPQVDQATQELQAETVPPVDQAAPQSAFYTQRARPQEPQHELPPNFTDKRERPQVGTPVRVGLSEGGSQVGRSSPGLFGLKTFLIGLIVFASLLHFSVIKADGHNDINGWESILKKDKEGTAGIVENAQKMTRQLLQPFRDSVLLHIPYFASIAIMLSGLYQIFASIGRKMRAWMGKNVSLLPPRRGNVILSQGLFLLVIVVLDIFAFDSLGSLGVAIAAFGTALAGLALYIGSFMQRRRHHRRMQ